MKIPFFHTFIQYTGGGTTTQEENQERKKTPDRPKNSGPYGEASWWKIIFFIEIPFVLLYGTVSSVSAAATGKIDWEKCPIHVCLAAIKRVGRYLVHFRKILEAVP